MEATWLLAQINAGSVDQYLTIVAWATAIVIALLFITAVAILRYYGIDREQREHLYAIRPQLLDADPAVLTVTREGGFSAVRPRVRAFYEVEDADPSPAGVRDAVRSLLATVRAALPTVPTLAVRGALEGAVILGSGVLLWASAAWIEWLLDPSGAMPGEDVLLWALQWLPSSEVLLSLALVVGLGWWELLIGSWWLVGTLLVVGALALALVDRRTAEDLSITLYPDRVGLLRQVLAGVGIILAAGILPNMLLTIAGVGGLGLIASILAVGLGLLGVGIYGAQSLRHVLVARQSRPDESTRWVAAYLLLRKSFGVLALLAVPAAIYFAARAVVVVGTWAVAEPLWAVLAVAAVSLATVTILLTVFGDETRRVGRALGRWLRSLQVRGWLFARGIPFTAMFVAMLTAWAFSLRLSVSPPVVSEVPVLAGFVAWLISVAPVLAIGLGVGVIARLATLLWSKAKYRFVNFDRDGGRTVAMLGLYPPIKDANGDILYVTRVDDHRLAHRDVDALLRDVAVVLQDAFDGAGSPTVTESRYYWEDIEMGTVDLAEVRRELRGDVRTRLTATVREQGSVDVDVIEEDLARKYPDEYVELARAREQSQGTIVRQEDEYVYVG
jgi:hypothetical protein